MSNYEVLQSGGVPIKHWTKGVEFEKEAQQQVINVASLPFIHKHIAIMSDTHFGMGATIGSVIPTTGAIIPAAIGVDIGCGMSATKLNIVANDLPDNLGKIRSEIERMVPHGRTNNGRSGDRGAWHNIPNDIEVCWSTLDTEYQNIIDKHPKIAKANSINHLGTLGTGNHFIELCLDEAGGVWLMLHSGSRGIGNKIGSYFISLAKEDMRKWFINLPDVNLAYLPEGTMHFNDYIEALSWAQKFAKINREIMLYNSLDAVSYALGIDVASAEELTDDFNTVFEVIDCHHNYVTRENHFGKNVWITRKGAVRARKDDYGIIPGSMGVKSFIVKGKGNPESFNSCSHGAGRKMSRTQAKKEFTVEDHTKATSGVECRKDEGVLDETPGAYKDIDAVMAAQSDLIDIVHTLKQVVCVKG